MDPSLLLSFLKKDRSFLPDRIRITSKYIGDLFVPSGYITVTDLCYPDRQDTLARRIAPGKYPVYIHLFEESDDFRVAFAELKLDGSIIPFTIEPAAFLGRPLESGGGSCIDSGTCCFTDLNTLEPLISSLQASDAFISSIISALEQNYVDTYNHAVISVSPENNAVAFTSGLGDGIYESFWGLTPDGTPCCLVTDFDIWDPSDED